MQRSLWEDGINNIKTDKEESTAVHWRVKSVFPVITLRVGSRNIYLINSTANTVLSPQLNRKWVYAANIHAQRRILMFCPITARLEFSCNFLV